MNLKQIAVGIALASSSAAAFAGATGNVGAFSEYLFRGIEQSGGAAVQGGLDYASDIGLYAGTWVSNTGGAAASGGTEWDLYGGYAVKAGPVGLDFGAIYYYYPEDQEDLGGNEGFDYPEIYAKASIGVFALQVYYTNQYLGDATETAADAAGMDTDFLYVNALLNFPISKDLTLGLQVGSSTGEGAEVAWGDEYLDYSVSLTKALDNGFAFSLGVYDTTLDVGEGFGTLPGDEDGFKAVVGLKKTFDL
jgi:uncharacterized protein (TIGR02001 family)